MIIFYNWGFYFLRHTGISFFVLRFKKYSCIVYFVHMIFFTTMDVIKNIIKNVPTYKKNIHNIFEDLPTLNIG